MKRSRPLARAILETLEPRLLLSVQTSTQFLSPTSQVGQPTVSSNATLPEISCGVRATPQTFAYGDGTTLSVTASAPVFGERIDVYRESTAGPQFIEAVYPTLYNPSPSLLVTGLAAGQHTYYATYVGSNFSPVAGESTTVTVTPRTPQVTVANDDQWLTAKIARDDGYNISGSVGGNVDFYINDILWGTAAVDASTAIAKVVSPKLPWGYYNLRAVYSGDASITAAEVTGLYYQSSPDPIPYSGASLVLDKSVYGTNDEIHGRVQFYTESPLPYEPNNRLLVRIDGVAKATALPVNGGVTLVFNAADYTHGAHEITVTANSGHQLSAKFYIGSHIVDVLAYRYIYGLDSNIQKQIAQANEVFKNSRIDACIRLVKTVVLGEPYPLDTQRLDYGAHLNYLATDPSVAQQRQACGADLVVFFKWGGQEIGGNVILNGLARPLLTLNGDSNAVYTVVNAGLDYTLAHEIGHNFGLGHAVTDPGGEGLTPYAHGYRLSIYNNTYRDVMAYEPGDLLPYYASPDVIQDGYSLGNANTADATRLVREMLPIVAAYRSLAQPFNGHIDIANATEVKGWAWDASALGNTVQVRIDINGTPWQTVAATQQRSDLGWFTNNEGRGFRALLPALPAGNNVISVHVLDPQDGHAKKIGEKIVYIANAVESALFNEAYYLQNNADVANAVLAGAFVDGREHFFKHGMWERRSPSALFNDSCYLDHNADIESLVQSGMLQSPFWHFAHYGIREGRVASAFYNEQFYLNRNHDVAVAVYYGAFGSGMEHFLLHGQYEARSGSPVFDAASYKVTYMAGATDALAISPSLHFGIYGNFNYAEPLNLFDEQTYLHHNADIFACVIAGLYTTGYQHFITYGWREGRTFSTTFDNAAYLAANADVAYAVAVGVFKSGTEHYLLYGQFENRLLA